MVEIIDIKKSFETKSVLHGISTQFETGKINCIIGKSGSGKTVLLKTIIGLEVPDSGKVIFDSREFTGIKTRYKKEIRREIGMVFQGGALFDSLTILENIVFPLEMFTNKNRKEKENRAHYCLQRVNLEKVDDLYPSELSGGMQKRAAIARAIVNEPKYLFCDEPNSGLDPITAKTIDSLIKDLSEEYKTTTIINTHDMNTVFNISDNVLFLSNGNKIWQGKSSEIINTEIKELKDFIDIFYSSLK